MEAVAAAASIAGIITLAAQAVDGLQKLHALFLDISTASKVISRLLADINSLIGVLHNIENVLNQAETQRRNQNFAQLDIKLDDCTKDVTSWLTIAKALRPTSEKGGRAWVKRARLAGKGEIVGRMREEIGRHRQALCLSLAVFGRLVIRLSFLLFLSSFAFPQEWLVYDLYPFSSFTIYFKKLTGNTGQLTFTLPNRYIRCAAGLMMR